MTWHDAPPMRFADAPRRVVLPTGRCFLRAQMHCAQPREVGIGRRLLPVHRSVRCHRNPPACHLLPPLTRACGPIRPSRQPDACTHATSCNSFVHTPSVIGMSGRVHRRPALWLHAPLRCRRTDDPTHSCSCPYCQPRRDRLWHPA
jgi:hypothetical protein